MGFFYLGAFDRHRKLKLPCWTNRLFRTLTFETRPLDTAFTLNQLVILNLSPNSELCNFPHLITFRHLKPTGDFKS